MSTSNGQVANATTFNNAYVSRTVDTSTVGVVALNNISNPNSGALITNTQRLINEVRDADGTLGEGDTSRKDYSSNNVVANGDNRKVAIGKLDAEFDTTLGHDHDGINSKQITIINVLDINQYFAEWQVLTVNSASGSSYVVTTEFTGLTAGGGASTLGVITSAPNNRCEIRTASTGLEVNDTQGQKVYARITESVGVWTLSFYTNEAGSETAHTLSSQNIVVYFREVFSQDTRPTIPADMGALGSLDLTSDVVDASTTERGVISTGTQSFAGLKTFTTGIVSQSSTKIDDDGLTIEQITTPSNPSAGYNKLYFKSDDKLYKLTSGGTETEISFTGYRAGSQSLSSGDSSKTVTFSTAFSSTNYRVTAQLVNTTDASPQFQAVTITAKTTTTFTAKWNAGTDSANYVLDYIAIADL